MAIVFFTGFELGSLLDLNTASGTREISSTVVRTGTYAFRAHPSTTGTGYCEAGAYDAAGNHTALSAATLHTRFYLRVGTRPASSDEEIIVYRAGGADKFSVRLNSSGQLAAYSDGTTLLATGSTVLANDTWYRIEVKAGSGASAAWEVRINGTTEVSGTSTLSSSNTEWVRFGKASDRNGQTVDLYYDDITCDDAAFPGPGEIRYRLPRAAGLSSQWSYGTNSSDWNEVLERPHDDATYVKCSADGGQQVLWLFTTSANAGIPAGTTVRAVKNYYRIREEVSGSSGTKVRWYDGTTAVESTARNVGTTFESVNIMRTANLTGGAWTTSILDILQSGVREGNLISTMCSQYIQQVEVVPYVEIGGSIPASTNVSGSANAARTLSCPIDASVSAEAVAAVARSIAGSIPASSDVSAAAVAQWVIGGAIPASSNVSGAAGILFSLSGSVPAVATVSGNAIAAWALAGSIPAVSSLTATALSGGEVSTQPVAASSSMVATVAVARPIAGSVDASSDVSASAIAQWIVGGTIPAVATVSAAAALQLIASAEILSESSVNGTPAMLIAIPLTISGASDIASGVQYARGLYAVLPASSGVAAAANVARTVTAPVSVVTGLGATLHVSKDPGLPPMIVIRATRRRVSQV